MTAAHTVVKAVKAEKPKLLILGTGWGGTSLLRALRRPNRYDITIASPRDHMLFTPLLASTATGALEHRSIIEPIRPLATKKNATFLNASATRINAATSTVHFEVPRFTFMPAVTDAGSDPKKCVATETFSQRYDILAIAVGATVNTFGIPGASLYALPMKQAADARQVRKRMHDLFEAASLPVTSAYLRRNLLTFVVCGAGPTGVELSAEIADWLRDVRWARRYGDIANDARVILVEAAGNVLSTFDDSLRSYALRRLRAAHVDVRLSAAVRRVEADAVVLSDAASGRGEERLACGMVVWTAGIRGHGILDATDLQKNERNTGLLTDAHLMCQNPPGVDSVAFAIGDCAHVKDNPLVPIAQVAEQAGIHVAGLLDRVSVPTAREFRQLQPFAFASRGMLAYVGSARGVASLVKPGARDPKRDGQKGADSVMTRGFLAWMTWRLAYFSKLGSFRNKVQVPLDWFKTALFGRDVSSF